MQCSVGLALVLLASCQSPASSDLPDAAPSPRIARAAAYARLTPRPIASLGIEAVRAIDQRAADAVAAHDGSAIRTFASPALDVSRAAQEVSSTECVGQLLDLTVDSPGTVLSRRVLGYPGGEGCNGVHELRLRYAIVGGEPRLVDVSRFGW